LFETGEIRPFGYEATLAAFEEVRQAFADFEVQCYRAVATCALREAKNGAALVSEVKKLTGLRLEIISGEEEASLICKAVLAQHPPSESALLIDIGGGSTELSSITDNCVAFSVSLPLGANRSQQEFSISTPAKGRQLAALRKRTRALLRALPEVPANLAIATSGSLRAMTRLIRTQDIEEGEFSCAELTALRKSLAKYTLDELCNIPLLEKKRADILVPAIGIAEAILRHYKIERVRTVNVTLKDGLLIDFPQVPNKGRTLFHSTEKSNRDRGKARS